jgi:UDP-3-O-[3-hydroxymyristoyl] glucosamine N-acyltransferase
VVSPTDYGTVSIYSTVSIDGAVSIYSTVTIDGTVTIYSTVTRYGTVSIDSTVSLYSTVSIFRYCINLPYGTVRRHLERQSRRVLDLSI